MCEIKNFYCWLLEFSILLLLLLALCLWLAIRPESPKYTIVDITIPKSDIDSGVQNGSIIYALEIENSNKQGRGKTRQVTDSVDANPQVWKAIRNSISNATAELKVAVLTRVQYVTWGVKSKHHGLDLQSQLSIGSNGKIFGKTKKIKLRRASKKWKRRTNRRRLLY
ncbi:PREDICTED: NDR1 [Prunus dulcis]|uniref:PREDICTED: NDR1 n=1 Tax=Prunus dulcis TaxID=3755 RepID=A0A5E4F0V0_PRUDU|nr:hypothetical protein L3X38_021077 [Prunus dulcis]VVA21664.1 PREDICTED: NDR1 [Prunus dulcis]